MKIMFLAALLLSLVAPVRAADAPAAGGGNADVKAEKEAFHQEMKDDRDAYKQKAREKRKAHREKIKAMRQKAKEQRKDAKASAAAAAPAAK